MTNGKPKAVLATDFFTVDELRCIHRDLFKSPWQTKAFYDERRAIIEKLDRYFGTDTSHLQGKDL